MSEDKNKTNNEEQKNSKQEPKPPLPKRKITKTRTEIFLSLPYTIDDKKKDK